MAARKPRESWVVKGLNTKLKGNSLLLGELLEQIENRVGQAIGPCADAEACNSWGVECCSIEWAELFCSRCGRPVRRDTAESIYRDLHERARAAADPRLLLTFPVPVRDIIINTHDIDYTNNQFRDWFYVSGTDGTSTFVPALSSPAGNGKGPSAPTVSIDSRPVSCRRRRRRKSSAQFTAMRCSQVAKLARFSNCGRRR